MITRTEAKMTQRIKALACWLGLSFTLGVAVSILAMAVWGHGAAAGSGFASAFAVSTRRFWFARFGG